ncbi:MAG: dihydrolipoamide acetyltransferase family protein [Alkalispirochaeta sp.]
MAEIVVLPQQGNSVEEVVLLDWNVAEGDSVTAGTVLCEVETDKATMEVESTAAGTVLKLLAAAGDEVPVKSPLVVVGEPGEDISNLDLGAAGEQDSPDSSAPQGAQESAATGGTPSPAGSSGPTTPSADASDSSSDLPASSVSSHAAPSEGTPTSAAGVSPRARMRAAERGVNLASVSGSGPGGRIIERDVLSASPEATASARGAAAGTQGTGIGGRVTSEDVAVADSPRSTPPPSTSAGTGTSTGNTAVAEEISVTGVRRVIADRMLASLQNTAQLTLDSSADARTLKSLRARFKQSGEELDLNGVNLNDMLMFAVVQTLKDHPELNAHFTGDTIRRFSGVDLGFAVDTPRGLLVPTVLNAHTLSLAQLSRQVKELAQRAIDGKATSNDLAPATFTVTNLGAFGIERFTPVLNPPQVAILGVNSINLKAVEGSDGAVEHVPHMGLSLTINHQVVDGAPGARFLQTLSRRLAEFDLLLAR